jgi:hypothetical protein
MRSLILCRERLHRIQRVLKRSAGETVSVRDFQRRYDVRSWELEQAAELGWLKITIHKPPTGRPSPVVSSRKLGETLTAKLPPLRRFIEKPISCRHYNFAMRSVCAAVKRGSRFLFITPPLTDAYLASFPKARNRAAATSSMSRLLKHPHVKAARAWFYAKLNREIPQGEAMPPTPQEIRRRLIEAGSSWAWRF